MASMSTWYHAQYSNWNRTRRLQIPAFVARRDTNTSRAATALAQNNANNGAGAITINMGDVNTAGTGHASGTENKDKKQDTLFGPNIGVVSNGPAWADLSEKDTAAGSDTLTPEIVKGWIAKSKQPSQPTTTLQALVNLKRPTIRLSPITTTSDDSDIDPEDAHDHHGLEFEYDADVPKCGIYVHVLLDPSSPHVTAETARTKAGLAKVLVFESVVDGGFGKLLKLEEGASLELGQFEHNAHVTGATDGGTTNTAAPNSEPSSTTNDNANSTRPAADRRHRFSSFHFRKRTHASHNPSVSGPALALVDAEPSVSHAPAKDEKGGKEKDDVEGVKVSIRLVAMDSEGKELANANEQVTYLHVVRFGAAGEEGVEDVRPWVVKVVKREATIGPHTFHLHEIYGLSSQSSAPSHSLPPPASLPDSTTYPPTSPPPAVMPTHSEEPSSECLLCLSSPREVVLLPCRHLVACKECALNMVEFGAGGVITQAEEAVVGGDAPAAVEGGETSGETAAEGATEGGPVGATAAPVAATPAVPTAPRRKRKAKGWFCPVCRQPYTSLLRITTTPPTKDVDSHRDSSEEEGAHAHTSPTTATPTPVAQIVEQSPGLLSSFRPSFLRGLSSRNPNGDGIPDLERGNTVAAAPAARGGLLRQL